MELVLASKSPRRAELLRRIVPQFEIVVSDVQEHILAGEHAEELCVRLARLKALNVFEKCHKLTLGCDTAVEVDGQILGKPQDREQALHFLRLLCDHTHKVVTGICVTNGHKTLVDKAVSFVTFRDFDEQVVLDYVNSGQCFDKAGGYGIQDLNDCLVLGFTGTIENIMGLPLENCARMLKEFGFLEE